MALKDEGFRFGSIGFSLFERAWTLRGMENLLFEIKGICDDIEAIVVR